MRTGTYIGSLTSIHRSDTGGYPGRMAAMNLFCLLSWLCLMVYEIYSQETSDLRGLFLMSGVTQNSIHKLDLESNSYTSLEVSEGDVSAFAYDTVSRRILYGSTHSIHVYSVDLDGCNVQQEATTNLYAQAIAIDREEWLMFIFSVSYGTIYKVDLGQDPTMDRSQIVIQHESWTSNMVADHKTRKLIWGSCTGLYQVNYNGSGVEKLMNTTGCAFGLTYDNSFIYVLSDDAIWKIDRENLTTTAISFFTRNSVLGLVIAENNLYFIKTDDCNTFFCNRSIGWISKDRKANGTIGPVIKSNRYSQTHFVYVPQFEEHGFVYHMYNTNAIIVS